MKSAKEIDDRINDLRTKLRLYENLKQEAREKELPNFNPLTALVQIDALEQIRWVLYYV